MGFLFSKIVKKLFGIKNQFNIHIVGLQNAGKTTILYRYNLGKVIETTPTLGSNMEEVTHNNVHLKVWDLGGQKSIRQVWDEYFNQSDAIIYVIDSKDTSLQNESNEEFQKLLKNELLKNSVILIFANKQDLENAMSTDQIVEKYKLSDIKSHCWHIQACSAINNQGLEEGLDWIVEKLLEKNK
ncbi:hypothetical protein IMG5_157450 [Ichthyophthirius multifiliis]|uniref:ADP-ribosylation factor n=1 Tax=Ichthyophthirius multifiliis TaxID=5932 RepID=G0QZK2_ICHMU|nr:hypothetical protein IMG5_157450 [Ichthyophthirius multifiliis]EGR29351.1 hypothetical protein IMG5_157450 [Ichthyophthirius multifiliis]|eukprot:XP_004030587.1 hypothetical protein IMG5_157450 [Ichthyophthirius multifiliis]